MNKIRLTIGRINSLNCIDAVAFLFLCLAVASGVATAAFVVTFRYGVIWLTTQVRLPAQSACPVAFLLLPPAAGMLVIMLAAYAFPSMGGSGVIHTKKAVYLSGGQMSFQAALGRLICSGLAISGGFSLGPEDPSLHIGAALAARIGPVFRPLVRFREHLAPIGAAAGLAVAFNAPASAVLFVIEEITGTWSARTLSAAMLAAASSVIAGKVLFWSGPLFHLSQPITARVGDIPDWIFIGLIGGVFSPAATSSLLWLRDRLRQLPRWTKVLQAGVAGLVIGCLGFLGLTQIMGAGYDVVEATLGGSFAWQYLLLLAVFKMGATVISTSSGVPGGLFAPILCVGALMGAGIGGMMTAVFPFLGHSLELNALVGMSAIFAGFLRAPLTAMVIAVEVTGSYNALLPATISTVFSYSLAARLQRDAIFDLLSRQDGIDLPSMEGRRELISR